MAHEALDTFGEFLMTRVRDNAITEWRSILSGHMRGESSKEFRRQLAPYGDGGKECVGLMVPHIVDTVLHHLLWSLEQSETIRVAVDLSDQSVESLSSISDGFQASCTTGAGSRGLARSRPPLRG